MSGQRIDDHSFWAGAKGKDAVFPDGPHKTKSFSSAEGVAQVSRYEDTSEAIKSQQMKSNEKVKSHPRKDGFRN